MKDKLILAYDLCDSLMRRSRIRRVLRLRYGYTPPRTAPNPVWLSAHGM